MSKALGIAATIAAIGMVVYLIAGDQSMGKCLKTNASFDTCHRALNP